MVSIWVGDHTVEGLNVDAVIQYCTIPEAEKQGLLYIVQYTHTNCMRFCPPAFGTVVQCGTQKGWCDGKQKNWNIAIYAERMVRENHYSNNIKNKNKKSREQYDWERKVMGYNERYKGGRENKKLMEELKWNVLDWRVIHKWKYSK